MKAYKIKYLIILIIIVKTFKKAVDTLGTAKVEDNQGETNQSENNNVKGSTIKVTFSDGKTKILPNNEEVKRIRKR